MAEGTERYWDSWGPHVWAQAADGDWLSPYANLARYVSAPALDGVPLLKTARPFPDDGSPRADMWLAGALFDQLKERNLNYALEPRLPRGYGRQRIRHPAWLVQLGWGTCLDLAVTYAAMCENEELAPLLVIGHGHAFVALTPGRPRELTPLHLPGCEEEEPGVLAVTSADRFREAATELLAVECTCAVHHGAGRGATDFAAAVSAGATALRLPELRIIDVARMHEPAPVGRGLVPLDPPRSLLDVGLYLPGGIGEQKLFGAQTAVFDLLSGARGVHVIAAEHGFGKSTVARRLVAAAPFGAGWFLGASDDRVLTNSLAAAELAERNRSAAMLWDSDREGYDEAARNRLREARHAWIVVLDNADEEPERMLRRLPMPRPDADQLLVITTTNRDWAAACGYPTHNLEALTPDEVMSELGNEPLVGLVGGRPLLVAAFQRLAAAIGVPTSELAVGDDTIDASTATGPRAFWSAVRKLALAPDEVTTASCASYLPPDAVSVSAVDAMHPRGTGAARLRQVGLLEHIEDEPHARLHRLFRDAIDADLHEAGVRDRVAEQVASTPEATANLAEFGDRPLINSLLKVLKRRDCRTSRPERELGTSFHAVGGVLELRTDTEGAADAYKRALRHLDRAQPTDRPLIADCLLGMARPNNRNDRDEADFRQGLVWADDAYQLMVDDGAEAKAGKYLAMRGLLSVNLAGRKGLSREEMVVELGAALKMIERADDLRRGDPATSPEELSRSAFNRARPYVRLADRDRANAAAHLDEAGRVYATVLARRREFYPHLDAHGHMAVCVWGLGLVDYLRAMWTSPPAERRQGLLRSAAAHAFESARQREVLAGADDDVDVSKSYRLIAKIGLARHLLPTPVNRRDSEHRLVMQEIDDELRDATLLD